jgi:hypothetical protein
LSNIVAFGTFWVQTGSVKTSIDLDQELADEVERTVSLIREKPATILRLAIRAGLPLIASRFQSPRPEGFFASAYEDYPAERAALESASTKIKTPPDRGRK